MKTLKFVSPVLLLTLSLLVAGAQVSLGVAIVLRPAAALPTAVALLELVLLQFYLLNVTIGLPPAIAHVHSGGEHVVWGYTFALPGAIDPEGVTAVVTEIIGAVTAVALSRSRAAKGLD